MTVPCKMIRENLYKVSNIYRCKNLLYTNNVSIHSVMMVKDNKERLTQMNKCAE